MNATPDKNNLDLRQQHVPVENFNSLTGVGHRRQNYPFVLY
jgi:hypothetical protein